VSRTLVSLVAECLVDNPGRVSVREFDTGQVSVLELDVHPDDRGKIIGREGRTIQSLRSLLAAAGQARGRAFRLELLD
jgi:predicted RNA-binding protein YlqC (UPF0109 family)